MSCGQIGLPLHSFKAQGTFWRRHRTNRAHSVSPWPAATVLVPHRPGCLHRWRRSRRLPKNSNPYRSHRNAHVWMQKTNMLEANCTNFHTIKVCLFSLHHILNKMWHLHAFRSFSNCHSSLTALSCHPALSKASNNRQMLGWSMANWCWISASQKVQLIFNFDSNLAADRISIHLVKKKHQETWRKVF